MAKLKTLEKGSRIPLNCETRGILNTEVIIFNNGIISSRVFNKKSIRRYKVSSCCNTVLHKGVLGPKAASNGKQFK